MTNTLDELLAMRALDLGPLPILADRTLGSSARGLTMSRADGLIGGIPSTYVRLGQC